MKVLIIEDDTEITRAIALLLELNFKPVKIFYTHSGEEATDIFKRENPDITLLEIGLLSMNGFEVLEDLRFFSDLPVIVVTAWADEVYRAKSLELGASAYLTKPFHHTDLLQCIETHLPRQSTVKLGYALRKSQ